jgi:hypothetical protein
MITSSIQYRGNLEDIENSLFREFLLGKIISSFKQKNFTLQFTEFEVVEPISTIELINIYRPLGELVVTQPNRFTILSDDYCIILDIKNRDSYIPIIYYIYTNTIDNYTSIKHKLHQLTKGIKKDIFSVEVRWYYKHNDGIDYVIILETMGDVFYNESYPYIEDLDGYIRDYINSNEQVLVLIGPPGTGKTRFIRRFLQLLFEIKFGKKKGLTTPIPAARNVPLPLSIDEGGKCLTVSYTTDSAVLHQDHIYIDLFSDKVNCLVLEDIDFNLRARKDGNTVMYKLLASSDGLLTNMGRKIIVTTNLENEDKIDPAFIRPGRCYDILKFDLLSVEEAKNLLTVMGVDAPLTKERYSLGEIYQIKNRGIK